MPIKHQWGFVFGGIDNRTLAHELGHGIFTLRHIFDEDYGLEAQTTDNLMHYSEGTEFVKYQWDVMHDPSELGAPWQRDAEGADLTDRTDVEYVVEVYSTYFSKLIQDNIKDDEMLKSRINASLKQTLPISKITHYGEYKDYIPLTVENELPAAILKHYPNAKNKGSVIYLTEYKDNKVRSSEPVFLEKKYPFDKNNKSELKPEDKSKSHQLKTTSLFNFGYYYIWSLLKSDRWDKESIENLKVYFSKDQLSESNEKIGHIFNQLKNSEDDQFVTIVEGQNIIYSNSFSLNGSVVPLAIYLFSPVTDLKKTEFLYSRSIEDLDYRFIGFYSEKNFDKPLMLIQCENKDYGNIVRELFGGVSEKKLLSDTKSSLTIANKFTPGTACNICVRSALYLLENDTILFPQSGSLYHDPNDNYKAKTFKGHITPLGFAKNIKEDFDTMKSKPKISSKFEEIKKDTDETWEQYFERLQDMANCGEIIIGVMLNSTGTQGHIMMVTPGELITIKEETEKWGSSFINRGISKVPSVLECGSGVRENKAALCKSVDRIGAQTRLKWYKYLTE